MGQHRWIYQQRAQGLMADRQATRAWDQAEAWISRSLPAEAVVCTNNPWLVNYRAYRPTVLCPRFSRADQVDPFLRDHQVAAVVRPATGEDGEWHRAAFLEQEARVRRVLTERFGPRTLTIDTVAATSPGSSPRSPSRSAGLPG